MNPDFRRGWFNIPLRLLPAIEQFLRDKKEAGEAEILQTSARHYLDPEMAAIRMEYVSRAQEEVQKYGEVEIDDDSTISESSDDGEYVLAWVWVSGGKADEEDKE